MLGRRGIRVDARAPILEIAKAILSCKESGLTEWRLNFDTVTVLPKIERYVIPHILVDCQECQEYTNILCSDCYNHDFRIHEQAIYCKTCGTRVDIDDVHCSEGHSSAALQLSDLVTLTPQQTLMQLLQELIQKGSDKKFDLNNEFFRMNGSTLYYSVPGSQILYSIYEIPEIRALLQDGAPEDQLTMIASRLGEFTEECTSMNTDECASCVMHRHGGPCYLRLFGLLIRIYP